MINKIYKTIHNKYFIFFKFLFFLRYVFGIFLISTSLFLSIPKFFNYEKKQEVIGDNLIKYYNLELDRYDAIDFKIFPFPNLLISNVELKIHDKPINIKSKNISIFLNLKNIYNYKNLKPKKIILNQNNISLEVNKIKDLLGYFDTLKYKLYVNNLNLDLTKNRESVIKIKDIYSSNYGYQKYKINGEVFKKKFKARLKNKNKNLRFKLLGTGINAEVNFNDNNLIKTATGSSKISLLNNLLRFNFNLSDKELKISKSNFRNKKISFSLDSRIKFNPFFSISSNINIKEIDRNFMHFIGIEKILTNNEIIKKLNSKIIINYENKKYFSSLVNKYSSNINLAYGRLDFSNQILIAGGEVNCRGDSTLMDEYPRLNFICLFKIKDKKKII